MTDNSKKYYLVLSLKWLAANARQLEHYRALCKKYALYEGCPF